MYRARRHSHDDINGTRAADRRHHCRLVVHTRHVADPTVWRANSKRKKSWNPRQLGAPLVRRDASQFSAIDEFGPMSARTLGEQLHERGLPCPVFSNNRDDLPAGSSRFTSSSTRRSVPG